MKYNLLKLKSLKIALIVFLLAVLLRVWGISDTPPSLYWDEVSQGYNAYSVLKTGLDEHKEFFPLARFQAFGDYKAPVYIYIDVLSIALFGNSEFAVRLPSAVLGSLTVLVTYFLVLELFIDNKRRNQIALVAMFLLAISPWHVQLSRVAYEANAATFFAVLGISLFLLGRRLKNHFLFLSVVSFVISFYAFNAHRIFIPLLFILLSVLFWKDFIKRKKEVLLSAATGFIILIPFLFFFLTPESRLRFNEVNIFTELSTIELSNNLVESDENSIIGRIIHNRRVLYMLEYVKNYFDFQNPSYLFFEGDQNPRFSTQSTGQLYLFTLPFILAGMYQMIKSKGKNKLLLFGWFLLAPVAAATARETPHALRSETFIPLYEIFASLGIVWIGTAIFKANKKVFWIFSLAVIVIAFYSLVSFLHMYFVHMPHKYSQDWQYGYKQTVLLVENLKSKYDKIVFTNAYGRAYIYVLWYGNYSPDKLWDTGIVQKDQFGFYNVHALDKYVFQSPNKYQSKAGEKILYVSEPTELPDNSRIIERIQFLDGSDAFIVSEGI